MATSTSGQLPQPTAIQQAAPLLVFGIPAVPLGLIGYALGGLIHARVGLPIFLIMIWIGLVIATGILVPGTQEFYVIERLGRFHRIIKRNSTIAFLLVPGVIDQVKLRDSFVAKEIELYTDEASNEIDFTDGSAPIDASAWYTIGNPEDTLRGNWDAVDLQVYLYTYSVGATLKRIAQLFEGALSPILQSKTIDEAQKNGAADGKRAADDAAPGLAQIGVFPRKEQPIIIHDIEVPPKIIELRNERLEGAVHAERMKREVSGYTGGILAVVQDLGLNVSNRDDLDRAQAIVFNKQALDSIKQTGANVHFFTRDVAGMIGTFNVGGKQ